MTAAPHATALRLVESPPELEPPGAEADLQLAPVPAEVGIRAPLDEKAWSTLRANGCLVGVAIRRFVGDNGQESFYVEAFGLHRVVDSPGAVTEIIRRAGVRSAA